MLPRKKRLRWQVFAMGKTSVLSPSTHKFSHSVNMAERPPSRSLSHALANPGARGEMDDTNSSCTPQVLESLHHWQAFACSRNHSSDEHPSCGGSVHFWSGLVRDHRGQSHAGYVCLIITANLAVTCSLFWLPWIQKMKCIWSWQMLVVTVKRKLDHILCILWHVCSHPLVLEGTRIPVQWFPILETRSYTWCVPCMSGLLWLKLQPRPLNHIVSVNPSSLMRQFPESWLKRAEKQSWPRVSQSLECGNRSSKNFSPLMACWVGLIVKQDVLLKKLKQLLGHQQGNHWPWLSQ